MAVEVEQVNTCVRSQGQKLAMCSAFLARPRLTRRSRTHTHADGGLWPSMRPSMAKVHLE